MQPAETPPTRSRRLSRGSVLVGLAVGLALGGVGAAFASSGGSSGQTTSAPGSTAPTAGAEPSPGQAGPPSGGALGHRHHTPSIGGTVTKVDGATLTLTDFQGFRRTIHTSSSTTYTRGGQPSTAAAVATGSTILATGTVDPDKTDLDASRVAVLLPRAAGKVTAVNGSSFTLQGRDGTTHAVTTTSSTLFRQGRNTADLSAVKVGAIVLAEGDLQAGGTLTATSVEILPAPPSGPAGAWQPGQGRQRPWDPPMPGAPGAGDGGGSNAASPASLA